MEIENKQADIILSAIRSVGSSFPFASSLVNAWNEYSSKQKEEKILRLIQDLSTKIENLDKSINKSEAECSEIFSLGLEYAIKEPSKEKIPIYSSLILSYCTNQVDRETVQNLIYECETILPYDIETLENLKRNPRIDEAFKFDESSNSEEVSKRQSSVKKLEAKGFLSITGDITPDFHRVYEQRTIWPFTFFVQFYQIMYHGEVFLKILKN
ncbi:hypothetical protein FCL47_23945 [Desulfopila sp. IMCC35006]|uniref:hypothetical protein n=1 Tax=Desulfopila sp. IMCC35006 TaxID=2569542 RepID=UPI0010AD74DC|nr:hypothetical protein [Desulfopila sp. IMCC35006]TKB23091.1 hypothetical protein FCL47_23945 [Desulfopila sp. IMCC35006]